MPGDPRSEPCVEAVELGLDGGRLPPDVRCFLACGFERPIFLFPKTWAPPHQRRATRRRGQSYAGRSTSRPSSPWTGHSRGSNSKVYCSVAVKQPWVAWGGPWQDSKSENQQGDMGQNGSISITAYLGARGLKRSTEERWTEKRSTERSDAATDPRRGGEEPRSRVESKRESELCRTRPMGSRLVGLSHTLIGCCVSPSAEMDPTYLFPYLFFAQFFFFFFFFFS